MLIDIIGWVGTILMFTGSIINIYKHIWCWPLWIIGGVLIIIQSISIGSYNIIALQLLYMPLNILGWMHWRDNE